MPKINPSLFSKSVVVPTSNYYAILDSGTTGNFVTPTDATHLQNPVPIDDGPVVLSASGNPMASTVKGTIPLSPHLTVQAQEAFELDELKTGTLISLSKLCDDDCLAIFSKYDVKIVKNDNVIITGRRMDNGLWSIPLQSFLSIKPTASCAQTKSRTNSPPTITLLWVALCLQHFSELFDEVTSPHFLV